jgi:hypothetical protein
LGVDRVKLFVSWNSLAPDAASAARPPGFDGTSPAAYPSAAWAPYDTVVRDAAARGIGVDLTVGGAAPVWATTPGQPQPGPLGVWKPSAALFGDFVRAVGTRYDGSFRPSGMGTPLPRVSFWSVWNEPNYGPDLAPQAVDKSTVEVSPRLYRDLLGAGWTALHNRPIDQHTILFGELAPRGLTVGDQPGNYSGMVPLRFLRALYCVDSSFRPLRGNAAAVRGCPTTPSGSNMFVRNNPALFKAAGFAAHPYPEGALAPEVKAPDEPDYADLASLSELERTLDRAHGAYGSNARLPIYSTEFGYITNPPSRTIRGTPLDLAAEYLNWAEYISWRDPRVRSYDQYLLRDGTVGNFASGLEFADGIPKPSFYAYRMPIYLPVTAVHKGRPVEVWGDVRPAHYAQADTGRAQSVRIQFKGPADMGFRTIRKVTLTSSAGYFDLRMAFTSSGSLRLAWTYPGGQTIFSRIVRLSIR